MKKTRLLFGGLLVSSFAALRCGGSDTASTTGGSSGSPGSGGSVSGAGGSKSTGGASSGTGGTAGMGGGSSGTAGTSSGAGGTNGMAGSGNPTDGGPRSDAANGCPAQAPMDGSQCATARTCTYGSTICDCARSGRDAGRQWTCVTLGGGDGGQCPATPPADGTPCTTRGLSCPDGEGGTCDCMGGMWGC